jgi:peptide methionine sulfoxide reductase msrA/msrB
MFFKKESLTDVVLSVAFDKKTEPAFYGSFVDTTLKGTYLCRCCGVALFRSTQKFHSGCGWASFDDQILDTVHQTLDADGERIEITCSSCGAHLGHLFDGEGFTLKNRRYCVNSVCLDFVLDTNVFNTEEIIVAGGCFWGIQFLFDQTVDVLFTEVGYIGGHKRNPTYEQVCLGGTGHQEALRVLFDPNKISAEQLYQYFFNIHDPTQVMRQGPDYGEQYQSVIFYYNQEQKNAAQYCIDLLEKKGFFVATKLLPMSVFWKAEDYHQDYYKKNHKKPYCHVFTDRFQ